MKINAKLKSLSTLLICFLTACSQTGTATPEAVVQNLTKTTTPTATATAQQTPRATATARVATPLVSPTPTATPTPIIYAVQPGDTLLKIAIQFDQTTEAIQEVNGITDPRFLQIGQTLIIPPPNTDGQAPPTPTPTPLPLTITSLYFQETPQGSLWILGTVENPGDVPLTEVVIEASLLDEAGLLLATDAAFTQVDVVQPDQAAPFAILLEDPPSNFAQYQVVAVSGVPLTGHTRYYFDLETFDLRGKDEGNNIYTVSGQLRNNGTEDVDVIRLVAIAYDDENRVLAQRQAELLVTLFKAGAITPFEVELIVPDAAVDHYQVLAEGLKAE